MENRQQRVAAIGVDQVVSIWQTMNDGCPYFAIFYNRSNKYFQFNRNDLEEAENYLRNNLQALQDAGDTAMYYLNIYCEAKPNYKNSEMICSFPFRLNAFNEVDRGTAVSGYSGASSDVNALVKKIEESHERELALTKKLLEQEYQNKPLDVYDRISGILETPGAAQMIAPMLGPVMASIMGIINKFAGITPAPMAQPFLNPALGAVEPEANNVDAETKLDQALDRLEKHGDLADMLTKLADFADTKPNEFKLYLSMLNGVVV